MFESFFIKDPWLSDVIKRPAFRLEVGKDWSAKTFKQKQEFFKMLPLKAPLFSFCKVPVDKIREVEVLESLGFRVVDTMITFQKRIAASDFLSWPWTVEPSVPEDQRDVVSIARRSFIYSRFHLDPHFSKEEANEVKGQWVSNYFTGKRGDQLWVARIDGKSIGFLLQLHDKSHNNLVIDLIAVSPDHLKKGVGESLIRTSENANPTFTQYLVGTQTSNISSVRLYEKLGFRLHSARYVLHYHSGLGNSL